MLEIERLKPVCLRCTTMMTPPPPIITVWIVNCFDSIIILKVLYERIQFNFFPFIFRLVSSLEIKQHNLIVDRWQLCCWTQRPIEKAFNSCCSLCLFRSTIFSIFFCSFYRECVNQFNICIENGGKNLWFIGVESNCAKLYFIGDILFVSLWYRCYFVIHFRLHFSLLLSASFIFFLLPIWNASKVTKLG